MMGVQLLHPSLPRSNVRAIVLIAALQPCTAITFNAPTEPAQGLPAPDRDAPLCSAPAFVEPAGAPGACQPGDVALVGATAYASLQDAIDAAPDGDVVFVCPGVHDTSVALRQRRLAIASVSGDPADTTLDGRDLHRVLEVADSTLTLSGLTLRSGRTTATGGGMLADHSDVRLVDTVWEDHVAKQSGGIASVSTGVLSIERSTLTGGRSAEGVGGLELDDVCAEIRDSVLDDNGGAIHFYTDEEDVHLGIWSSALRDNASGSDGAAVSLSNREPANTILAMWDATVERNVGGYYGAIEAGGRGAVNVFVTDSTFADNEADYSGGALSVGSHGSTFLTVTNGTFTGNEAGYEGGAIAGGSHGPTVVRVGGSSFVGNDAVYSGGAISTGSHGSTPVLVTSSTFEGNGGGVERGGAIAHFAGDRATPIVVRDTAFVDNRASLFGSAIELTGWEPTNARVVGGSFTGNTGGARHVPAIEQQDGELELVGVDFDGTDPHLRSPCGDLTLGAGTTLTCDDGVLNP